jgi:hypothetical protein
MTMSILENFIALIKDKMKAIEELSVLDKHYYKTLPNIVKK